MKSKLQKLFSALLLLIGIGLLLIAIRSSDDNFLFSLLLNIGSALLLGGIIGVIEITFINKEYEEALIKKIDKLDLIINKEEFGIIEVKRRRNDLLEIINDKVSVNNKEIKIAGISLRGLFGTREEMSPEQKQFRINLERALKKRISLKILLIHPQNAKHRENIEQRKQGDIAYNTFNTLLCLIDLQRKYPKQLSTKLMKGVPSTYMIFFNDELIFSPYTYGNTGIESYTFRIKSESDLYHFYNDHHFENIWNNKDLCVNLEMTEDFIDNIKLNINNTLIADDLKIGLLHEFEEIKSATNIL